MNLESFRWSLTFSIDLKVIGITGLLMCGIAPNFSSEIHLRNSCNPQIVGIQRKHSTGFSNKTNSHMDIEIDVLPVFIFQRIIQLFRLEETSMIIESNSICLNCRIVLKKSKYFCVFLSFA